MPLTRTATSSLALRVPDIDEVVAFYTRVVGLRVHSELGGGGARLGWGTGHHVLDLLPGERALELVAFEVAAPGLLDELAGTLGAELDVVDGIRGFEIRDPDGNRVRFHDIVDRAGEQLGDGARRPIRYQHVTLATSDLATILAFYTDRVGFRLSDMMADGVRLAAQLRDHHTLAVVRVRRPGAGPLLLRPAELGATSRRGATGSPTQGVDVSWGPGRHGPGNNLFVFFDDPAGNHVELSAEMEKFHDDQADHPVRRWRPVPRSVNLWGGQLAAFRTTSEGA